METLTSREKLLAMVRTEDEEEYRDMSENDMMDCANLMQQWGFDDVRCHNCGVLNSQCNGLLMQCAKCKKCYYCSAECFNQHLPVHRLTCDVGNIAHRNPVLTTFSSDSNGNNARESRKDSDQIDENIIETQGQKEYHYKHAYPGTEADSDELVEEKLLVLYASTTMSKKQHKNMKKAFEMLDENDVLYEALDALEPANKERCERLYAMANQPTEFPQFFRTKPEGDMDYIGGWEDFVGTAETEFEDVSESDHSKTPFVFADHKLRRKASIWAPRSHPTIIIDSDDEMDAKRATHTSDDKRPSCPVRQHSNDSESSFLILYSSEPEDRSELVDQQMLTGLLNGNDIRYDLLDGLNPSTEETRDALFDLSGAADRYPQIFKGESDGRIHFWGGFSDIQSVARKGGLMPPGRMKPRRRRKSTDKTVTLPLKTLFEENEEDLLEFDDTELLAMQRPTDHDNCADSRPRRPIRRNSDANETADTLVVLYTKKTKNVEEIATQQMMTGVLEGNNLKYEAIDGSNPDNSAKRDELFEISGRKDEYPQFYTVGVEGTKFLGGWNKFDEASREGDLDQFAWDDEDDNVDEGTEEERLNKRRDETQTSRAEMPRKPTRTWSDSEEPSMMSRAGTSPESSSFSGPLNVPLRGSEIVKKEYTWEKPEWAKKSPLKRRSHAEQLHQPSPQGEISSEFDRGRVELHHAEIRKNAIGWEVPEWAKRRPLRKTSKGQLIQSLGDFEGYKHIKSPERPPEWVVRSPLKKKKSPGSSPSSFTEGSDDGIVNVPNLSGLPSKLPLD